MVIPPVSLQNGGFDALDIPAGSYQLLDSSRFPGWTSDSGLFEVWHRDYEGVGSANGNNLIELNATNATTIHQDFDTTPGTTIKWSFSHRGRSGRESTELLLGPSNGSLTSIKTITNGREWKTYSGSYDVPAGQTSTRIAFRALTPGSVGNFLDAVQVRVRGAS